MADNFKKIKNDLEQLQQAFKARIDMIQDLDIKTKLETLSEGLTDLVASVNDRQLLSPSSYDRRLLDPKLRALEVYQSYKASLPGESATYEYRPNESNYTVGYDYKIGQWVTKPAGLFHVPSLIYFYTPEDAEQICAALAKLLPTGPRHLG